VIDSESDTRPEPRPRQAGRFLVLLAGLILVAAAAGIVWLHQTHRLEDLSEQPPSIAVAIPAEAITPAAATAQEATPAVAADNTPIAPGGNAAAETATNSQAATETATVEPPSAEAAGKAESAGNETANSTVAPSPPAPPPAPATEAEAAPSAETAPAAEAEAASSAETSPVAEAEAPPPIETAPAAVASPPATETVDSTTAAPTSAAAEAETPDEATTASLPVVPLPRLKPPFTDAPATVQDATAEPPPPAAPAVAEPTSEAVASPLPALLPGTSLGATATAEAITAPSQALASPTAMTQTASVASPAPSTEPPWKRNARPFPIDDPRPRLSLVITGLGLSAQQTQAAIDRLPPDVTLAFSPYSGELQNWIAKARAAGHEVLIELPMEPLNYPADDPGPQALLAGLSAAENLKRLDWVLARDDRMTGLVANMGSRFQASARLIRPILTRLAEKGYLYIDNRSGPSSVVGEVAASIDLPWTYNTRFIDSEATRVSIDGRLQQLERTAREKGFALGLAQGYPVTIERVAAWAKSLDVKGLALAPASAVAKTGTQ
jgi:polysaccharide deacetylase 2 family uncharacterized protein YibQ